MKKVLDFFSYFDVKQKYLVGLIIGIVFVLNYPKLKLYFISDDFTFIYRYRFLKDVFNSSAAYHVNPVPQFFIFYLGNLFAGFNPLYYHAITLLLHSVNVVLVFNLAQVLFRNKWTSLMASLLFATYFMNYEVVYWITGIFYILLTLFSIATLLFFIRYLNTRKRIYYALFVTTFALAILTMEQGITLLFMCILCEMLLFDHLRGAQLCNWKQKVFSIARASKKYIPLFITLIFFFILKQSMKQNFILNNQTMDGIAKTILGTLWHLFVPYPYGMTSQWNYRIYLVLLAVGLISFLLIKQYRGQKDSRKDNVISHSEATKYLLLLSCILSYVIPQSIATIMQARYFYLPSVFSSIIIGNLLIKSLSQVASHKSYGRLLFHSTIIFFIVASVPVNIRFLNKEYDNWRAASQVTKNIINDANRFFVEKRGGLEVFFVNLPDGIYTQNNFGWPNAYIFRNGISYAIKLTYPTKRIGLIMSYRTEDPDVITSPLDELITKDQLHQLTEDEENIVLLYDAKIQTIRRLMPDEAL